MNHRPLLEESRRRYVPEIAWRATGKTYLAKKTLLKGILPSNHVATYVVLESSWLRLHSRVDSATVSRSTSATPRSLRHAIKTFVA